MKRAVVTLCCGEFFERLAEITHPTIRAYADRIGADFIVWREFGTHTMPHYQKLELGKLLEEYDRVLYLDTDVLVRDDAPDLFQLVPADKLGMLDESEYVDRKNLIIQYMLALNYDAKNWDGRYYNTGVMVLSPQHRKLFEQPALETEHFYEQTHLNHMISMTRTSMQPLPYRFNRMYFMDWKHGEHTCDSFIIHYAGISAVRGEEVTLALATEHLAIWQETRPGYQFPKSVLFNVQGRLGDQAAAEPTIRYAREVLHAHDRLMIVSTYGWLFAHLGIEMYLGPDRAPPSMNEYLCCNNLMGPGRPPLPIKTGCVHCINYASLNMLGVELPIAYRRPRLTVEPDALASVRQKVAPLKTTELVVMHAAGTTADAHPLVMAWQAYARILVERGHRVVVIGHRDHRDLVVTPFDTTGCLDLVDRLSLGEIVALLSEAPVLLTSSPDAVLVAGAFDHWIGILPPGPDPENILAWRHGSQSFRAQYLGVTTGCEPLASYAYHAEVAHKAGMAYNSLGPALPPPQTVLQFVLDALSNRD